MRLAAIGIAGFFGAIARYLVSNYFNALGRGEFPWGTLIINISGSFLLGFIYAVSAQRITWFDGQTRAMIGIGFIGSYTTFSTFSFETLALIENGNWPAAGGNVAFSLAIGIIAVFAGAAVGRLA